MPEKLSITIITEREKVGKQDVFVVSSPDINVLAEGKTIDEAQKKFLNGVKFHLKNFPGDRTCLIKKPLERFETPMVSRIFL